MAATSIVRLEDYLKTSYENPDPEFVHGQIIERATPPYLHARIQKRLAAIFDRLEERLPLFACTELRILVAPGIVRVPDLTVFSGQEPTSNPVSEKPLVAVEVSSPDDRISAVLEKLEEYRAADIEHIWFIDPAQKSFYVYSAAGLQRADAFRLSAYGLEIRPADVYL